MDGAGVSESSPTGLAPFESAPLDEGEALHLVLEFDATQAEPALENMFLAKGGTLAGAAARGPTEFAVSGSLVAEWDILSETYGTAVRIPLPEGMAVLSVERPLTVDLDNRSKLIVSGLRKGASINGSLGDTLSGQGAIYLANMLRVSAGSALVPLTYSTYLAQTAVVATNNARITDQHGRRYAANFVKQTERDVALDHAEQLVGKWAEGAWALRTAETGLVYKHSPSLTKCVAKTPCGVNDTGFTLVHDVLEMRMPYSWETMNSLFENAVQVELEFIPEDIATFLGETKAPGLKAAAHARSLSAALSMIAALTVSYRADGRTRLTAEGGQEAVAAELWLVRPPGPSQTGDCDDVAILTTAIVNAIGKAPPEVLAAHEYLNAAKNIVYPYYAVGLTVLGASGAEASGSNSQGVEKPLAGHAATLAIPTLHLLRAAHKGGQAVVGGAPVIEPEKRDEVAEARLASCFPPEVLAALPEEERGPLERWSTAKFYATELVTYGIEGTTPASPILYATGKAAKQSETQAARDMAALSKAAPNVGRSVKILHVGGSTAGNPHMFYHDFVEFDLPRSHPLWSHDAVRAAGAAATQFVFAKPSDHASGAISVAGATPRDLVREDYAAVPLVVANGETAKILDYASEQASLDVMPPRPPGMLLDAHQLDQLTRSLASLEGLDDALNTDADAPGHTVAYLLAYNCLINNAGAVDHFCNRLKEVAVSGSVDALDVLGMALTKQGKEAGKFVVINACIPI